MCPMTVHMGRQCLIVSLSNMPWVALLRGVPSLGIIGKHCTQCPIAKNDRRHLHNAPQYPTSICDEICITTVPHACVL